MDDDKTNRSEEIRAAPQREKRSLGLGIALGAGATVAAAVIASLGVVYSGAYNVAATEEHSALGRWAFETTFHNAVRARADGLEPPPNTPEALETGAAAYKAMCQHCHGGPGVERADWASGMRPRPPHLTDAASRWETAEVFWLAKHGVKMTGMPSFGATHDDNTLWGVATFVNALPGMAPERYAALGAGSPPHHGPGETADP